MKKIKSRVHRKNKCKIFKRIFFLFALVIVFSFRGYVNSEMNDSLLERNRIDDIYARVIIDGKARIFYLNMYEMNGRIAYCIDLGVDITTSIYHSTNDFSSSHLTSEQIDYIKKVSYFGYGYEGHNDYRYYMASQEIIWEYLNNNEVEWISDLTNDGEKINIEFYKNEILALINFDNEVILDFGMQVSDVYTVGDIITLSDTSGFLSNYEVISSKYSNAVINGNKLIIEVGNVIGDEVIELKRKGYYDYDSLLYYYDSSQRLISSGNYSNSNVIISFKSAGAIINGKVVASSKNYYSPDVKYSGSVYELYDGSNKLIDTYETDGNGNFKIDNLLLGTYYIKQVKASEGFLVNDEVVTINVDKKINDVTLKQDFITNKFRITKVYGSNGSYKPEYGVSFRVYYSDGSHYCCLSTNKNGINDFELAYGKYRISQVNTLFGYSKVDDFFIEVSDSNILKKYYNLVDELIQVNIKVISLESSSKKRLNLEGFSYKIRKKGESNYLEFDGESVIKSDNDGILSVPGFLGYGDYILEQVSVPQGVLLNNEVKEFRIDDNSNIELISDKLVMNVEFYNELVMGEVNVLSLEEKYYKETNNFGYEMVERDNAEYSLIASEDIIINGEILYSSGHEVYKGVTDLGKLVINNLHLGSYCLIDQLTYEKQCFALESVDDRTKIVNKSMKFVKYLDKHSLVIKNISNSEELIANSMFEIIDSEEKIIYTGITNWEGIIKVDNLLTGDYCVRQTKVLSKYEMENNKMCFLLDDDKTVTFVNDVTMKELINVPDTLSQGFGFYEFGVILFMMGIGIFVYKKIFDSKLYR